MSLADSHCHLDDKQFDSERREVIERAIKAGVELMLTIGSGNGPPDLEAGLRIAADWPQIYVSVGVHPHEASKWEPATYGSLRELARNPKILAIGEIGLDYHYDFSPREAQREVFLQQIRLAREVRKPVIIHTREAWDDTLALLREHWAPSGQSGIMHCFSGGPEEMWKCIEMGFYISFAGVVTFPKALQIQQAAREVPIERMLVETDAPYLAPVPERGKRNEPAFVVHTARRIAELRGVHFEEITAVTTANFKRLLLNQ